MRVYITRFIWTAVLLGFLLVLGTVGYIAIEGWSIGDAAYMTAITLTAVGYEEVHPLSPGGRLFTGILLAGGLTGMGLWFAFLTSFIVELDLGEVLLKHRTRKEIARMQNHVIVCGAGRTGSQVIEELLMAGQAFTVIERDPEQVRSLRELLPDVPIVEGDATVDHFLLEAGVDRARGLVACLSQDTDNLFVCLSARDLRPDLKIVARAFEDETVPKLYRAGANHVVSPNTSGGIRMASFILRPSVVSFLDVVTRSPELSLRLEEARVEADSPLAGRTLAEARIPQRTGLIVIALRKQGEEGPEFVFNPVADTRLEPGDEMIVLGKSEQIEKLRDYVGG